MGVSIARQARLSNTTVLYDQDTLEEMYVVDGGGECIFCFPYGTAEFTLELQQ